MKEVLLWDLEQTRKKLGKSVHSMRWLVRKRAVPLVRIQNRIYFSPSAISKWIDEHSIPAYEGKIKNGQE